MIRILTISALLALSGCTRDTKLKGPPPTCYDGRPPVVDLESNDNRILVCGTPTPGSHAMTDGSVILNDFSVFQMNEKGERSFLADFSEKDETLKASKEGERVRVTRMINLGGDFEAYERFFFECDGKKGCKRTSSECVLEKKKEGYPLAMDQLKESLKGHDFSFVKPHLLNQTAYEAHFGNAKAAEFMANEHKKLPEKSAWKPAFSSAEFFHQNLAVIGCK